MKTRLIGVAGASGAGKTTVATKIHESHQADSVIISCDNYYKDLSHLPKEERAKVNFDHPDSIDFDLLVSHLEKLKSVVKDVIAEGNRIAFRVEQHAFYVPDDEYVNMDVMNIYHLIDGKVKEWRLWFSQDVDLTK